MQISAPLGSDRTFATPTMRFSSPFGFVSATQEKKKLACHLPSHVKE
jgi:hypothetical protein